MFEDEQDWYKGYKNLWGFDEEEEVPFEEPEEVPFEEPEPVPIEEEE